MHEGEPGSSSFSGSDFASFVIALVFVHVVVLSCELEEAVMRLARDRSLCSSICRLCMLYRSLY